MGLHGLVDNPVKLAAIRAFGYNGAGSVSQFLSERITRHLTDATEVFGVSGIRCFAIPVQCQHSFSSVEPDTNSRYERGEDAQSTIPQWTHCGSHAEILIYFPFQRLERLEKRAISGERSLRFLFHLLQQPT